MTKTVTSLFHSEQHATEVAGLLQQAGIPKDAIDIWTTPHNLAPLLEDLGVSRSDAYAYVEGVLRGGTVVIVKCDAAKVGPVVGILYQEGVLELDKERTSWRAEGWLDQTAGLGGAGDDLTGSPDITRARTDRTAGGSPDEAGHGRVRIHPRNVERPAQE